MNTTTYTNPIQNTLTDNCRILAQDKYINNDTWQTGINNNDLIIGVSGAGKTRSYVIPNILHSNESMIVVDTKNSLFKKLTPYLKNKGYAVWNLNFARTEQSEMGYNPLHFIERYPNEKYPYNTQDIEMLCQFLCPIETLKDPFWDYAARMYMATMISYVLEALPENEKNLGSVAKIQNTMGNKVFEKLMNEWEAACPESYAVRKWHLFKDTGNADKTHASTQMIVGEKLSSFSSNGMMKMFSNPKQIDFRYMSEHKTVLFVNVSDSDRSCDRLLNILYSQALHALCACADEAEDGRLRIPVRLILDDFAANATIPDFDKIISVVRSREIYISIILQSLTQLDAMYGPDCAKTIINNCDSCLYLGGQDVETARYISTKANKTTDTILNMPINTALLFVRGQRAQQVTKYSVEADPLYRKLAGAKRKEVTQEELPFY